MKDRNMKINGSEKILDVTEDRKHHVPSCIHVSALQGCLGVVINFTSFAHVGICIRHFVNSSPPYFTAGLFSDVCLDSILCPFSKFFLSGDLPEEYCC